MAFSSNGSWTIVLNQTNRIGIRLRNKKEERVQSESERF